MTLTITGNDVPMGGHSISYPAEDDQRNPVTVQASCEAIQDHGVEAVQQKAREKYAAGNYTQHARRVVTVNTDDF